ncbi:uncharacterized protein STEHIDRAFT_161338 [Stereum hirsutum FP-91666 SS1]|uniref:uncharacterized protein n=1 Tax=Stereum hirsutum (strain FP-91666) TaxID=721885 RepID=UPI0004449709|nr:uncharacterized protein STEHIDRAFT_161338 [Stereum hirsutum FP-91666 SS1]EIM81984.1 hypothetical protein STEHIDRAFT_161338 [Stereum hirsutum FP-91666 SS1]
MRRFLHSNRSTTSSIFQIDPAPQSLRDSDASSIASCSTAPPSYSEEEWSVDSRYADTDAGDSTIANADTDSELSHNDLDPPAPTYTPERSTTPTLTRPGTPADFKNPRFAFVSHSRAPSGASTASIIATASSSTVSVGELIRPDAKASLRPSSSAIMIAWSAPDPAMVTVEDGPTKYALAPRTPNSMLVLPPSADAGADSGENALYRISVNSNCFMPSSYITTIRRGGSEDGEFVGDFEIGDSMVKWTITIGEQQMLLQNIMTTKKEEAHVRASLRTNARAAPVVAQAWDWNFRGIHLQWSHVPRSKNRNSSKIMVCHHVLSSPSSSSSSSASSAASNTFRKFKSPIASSSSSPPLSSSASSSSSSPSPLSSPSSSSSATSSKNESVLIATFDPADPSSWTGEFKRRPKELIVYPEGKEMMDVVVISLMVAERMRLMLPS